MIFNQAIQAGGGTPTLQAKTNIAPTTSSQTITPDQGYDGLSSVQINAISPIRTSSNVTVSGANVTIPNGYYSSQVTKSVASGTAGTPTATTSYSGNTAYVTPAVTNTTGYITGGTKYGSATAITASALVSGTKSITANGTGIDVTNYASVDVNVSGGGGGSSDYTLIGHGEFAASTTSTTESTLGTLTLDSNPHGTGSIIYVKVRDKAGKRNGFFYGSDSYFYDFEYANKGTDSILTASNKICYALNSSGKYTMSGMTSSGYGNTGYGVYAYSITASGAISIRAKYNSTLTQTVNGTYSVDAYLLKWPDNISPLE